MDQKDEKSEERIVRKKNRVKAKFWTYLKDATSLLLLLALIVCMAFLLIQDAWFNGLGTANGKFVSFADSLNSCASFRSFQPPRKMTVISGAFRKIRSERFVGRGKSLCWVGSPKSSWSISLSVVFLAVLAKFGSQSLGSALLGETPTILKGPRHAISFIIAFVLVQLTPGDIIFTSMNESAAIKLLLRMHCALYKVRKFNFVVGVGTNFSTAFTILVQLVIIDGNTLFQNIELTLFTSKVSTWSARLFRQLVEARKSAQSFFLLRSLPLALLTWIALSMRSSNASALYSFLMRLAVLLFFLRRYDIHHLVQSMWSDWYANEFRDEIFHIIRKLFRPLWILHSIVFKNPLDDTGLASESEDDDSEDLDDDKLD